MSARKAAILDQFMETLTSRHEGEDEFLQAVKEVAGDVLPIEKASHDFTAARALERLCEADRVISFRVTWRDDAGAVQINRGWRVQHSNLLGPYKGGLRWVPGLTESVLKFLAFEQAFKNALTGLPLGAAKGGADFDPSERSPAEIERFAAAFMAELAAHIGPDRDVPAGDIGVGGREIGLMQRAWMQHARKWGGAMTGKPLTLGGSEIRKQATGYGLIYFTAAMLADHDQAIAGKRIALSGRGNVSGHAARKAMAMGAKVITLSGRDGTWHAPDGFSHDALDWVIGAQGDAAFTPPGDLGLRFAENARPWDSAPDIALPCATQNELALKDAKALTDSGCRFLAEGANMPLTAEAEAHLTESGVIQVPGKAANAGGVAVSGLEMQQNAGFDHWSADRVDAALCDIMTSIHSRLKAEAGSQPADTGQTDYRRAANVVGYRKLAQAVVDGGVF